MLEVGRLQPGDVVEYEIAKKGFTYALLSAGDDRAFHPSYAGTVLRYRPLLGYRAYHA